MTPDHASALASRRARRDTPVLVAPRPASPRRPPRGEVPRGHLLRRLIGCHETPVVTIVAPAGYGKTTLAAQWVRRDARPYTWLSLREDATGAMALRLAEKTRAAGLPRFIVVDDAQLVTPQAI